MDLTTRFVQSSTAISAEIDGQLVALDVEQGVCFGLNSMATRIWHVIKVPCMIVEICDDLMAEFAVGRDACERDVAHLLNDLLEAQLIVVSS